MTTRTTEAHIPEPAAFKLRDATDDDLRHIVSSWVSGYSRSTFARAIEHCGGAYPSVQDKIAKDIIARGAKLTVANPLDDSWFIMGWVCFDRGVLHFLHVRSGFQNKGIGEALLEHAGSPKFATHLGIQPGTYLPQRDFIREAYKFALEKTCASHP